MRWSTVSATLALLAVAAACASPDAGGGSGWLAGGPHALDGRSFVSTRVLEDGAERPLVPGTRIELSFSEGRLSARAGCNLMGAPYRLAGDRLRLTGDVSMTEMGCDPERHEQDAWLSAFLGSSPRVRLDGAGLTLVAGRTRIELVDREVVEPDLPLEGTRWELETIVRGGVASSVPAGLHADLRITEGRIGGFNGCNEWGAQVVSTSGGVLVLGEVAQTQIGCAGAAAALERDVNAVITAERIAYEIDGASLVLRAADRELHFEGEPAPAA